MDLKIRGKATLVDKTWQIETEPQIRMRLKAALRKISVSGSLMLVSDTEENCRDLLWFSERFPLEFEPRDKILAGAQGYEDRYALVNKILGDGARHEFDMVKPPRDYQRQAAALTLASQGLLVADELGLGKTVTAICVLVAQGRTPAVVVCPVALQLQWRNKLAEFAPQLRAKIIRSGNPTDYKLTDRKGQDPHVLILTYAKLSGWSGALIRLGIQTVVYDEIQDLRHPKTNKHASALALSEATPVCMGLSATPIHNYGGEFFHVLECVRPSELGTWEEFRREWCIGTYEEKCKIVDPKAFGGYLREKGIMVRRTRQDVGRELPKFQRILQMVEDEDSHLSSVESAATELALQILDTNRKPIDQFRAAGEFSMILRQATGIAKAHHVALFVEMLLDTGEPVVLFGWHHAVYKIWEHRLKFYKPAWCTGRESDSAKAKSIQSFCDGDTNLIIMSLRSSAGIDGLQHRCATTVHGELDWSPAVIDQCDARVARDGQLRPVTAYYMVAPGGCDPYMAEVLGLKREQLDTVLDPNAELIERLEIDPNHVKKLALAYLAQQKVKDHGE